MGITNVMHLLLEKGYTSFSDLKLGAVQSARTRLSDAYSKYCLLLIAPEQPHSPRVVLS